MTTLTFGGSSLQEIQEDILDWANSAHPDRTPESTLLKLFEELGEIVSCPDDASEYADAFIVLLDVAYQNRITGGKLEKAINEKMAVNRNRTWRINELGILKHE